MSSYVIITPAHNEAELIIGTIESIIAQTIHPKVWLLVDDGSTDGMSEIVKSYQVKAPFLRYLYLARDTIRTYYARRTHVFLAGYEVIKREPFEFLAALDADIHLESRYYETILAAFAADAKLGIASGVYEDVIDNVPRAVLRDPEGQSTPGGIHVFRRACYEQIGGYKPLLYGGDDSLANIEAQMHGWRTRALPECRALHFRPVGTRGGASILGARYRQGMAEYDLGSHPLFMLAKSLRRAVKESPLLIGSAARLAGYCRSYLLRKPRSIPRSVERFVQGQQLSRLGRFLGRR